MLEINFEFDGCFDMFYRMARNEEELIQHGDRTGRVFMSLVDTFPNLRTLTLDDGTFLLAFAYSQFLPSVAFFSHLPRPTYEIGCPEYSTATAFVLPEGHATGSETFPI